MIIQGKNEGAEAFLERRLANHLNRYDVPRFFDMLAGMKLPRAKANLRKELNGKTSKGYPDLNIPVPRRGFIGLFIELKADGESPYLKDGVTPKKDKHTEDQAEVHKYLRSFGHKVEFATGFKEAIKLIDWYLGKEDDNDS